MANSDMDALRAASLAREGRRAVFMIRNRWRFQVWDGYLAKLPEIHKNCEKTSARDGRRLHATASWAPRGEGGQPPPPRGGGGAPGGGPPTIFFFGGGGPVPDVDILTGRCARRLAGPFGGYIAGPQPVDSICCANAQPLFLFFELAAAVDCHGGIKRWSFEQG